MYRRRATDPRHPLRPDQLGGARILLNSNLDTQILDLRFIVTAAGHDRRLNAISFITPGRSDTRSPVFHWRLFRHAGRTAADRGGQARDDWSPIGGSRPAAEPIETGGEPYYAEDLADLEPLKEGEILTLHLLVPPRGLSPYFEQAQIRSELRFKIEGLAVFPFPLHFSQPEWGAEAGHFLALDYGHQDFMLAYIDQASRPRCVTPSVGTRPGERDRSRPMPESSKAVVIETFDPQAPVFAFGNTVEMVSEERLEQVPIWADPEFTGSRLESLKPYLYCNEDSVLSSQSLFGQPPHPANVFDLDRDGLALLLKRYFQKLVGTIDWSLSNDNLGTRFRIHSPIIITHPVGAGRQYRRRVEAFFKHDPPYLNHDRKVIFINEAMAALGTIWCEQIQGRLDALDHEGGRQRPTFRHEVRRALGLPLDADDGQTDRRGNEVLILQADVGHGTTDLCISRVERDHEESADGRCNKLTFRQVLPYSLHCGGRDLTRALYHHCIDWLRGRTEQPAPDVPAPILDVLTTASGVSRSPEATYFWRFLKVVEDYKKLFADETTGATDCSELLAVCEAISQAHGPVYPPSEDDKSYAINAQDVKAAMRPVAQKIARTVGALKQAYESKTGIRIDLFAFVGQSIRLKMLREEIVAELGASDPAPVADACIFLEDASDLKGAVAKGALYLLGPMTGQLEAADCDRLLELPYSVYARSFRHRILPEGLPLRNPAADGTYTSETVSLELAELFPRIPHAVDIKIRYDARIADPVSGQPQFLDRTLGRLFFPPQNLDQPAGEGDRVELEYTSDEYLIARLCLATEDQPLELMFEKQTMTFQESVCFYNMGWRA